jgi:dihydrofolate reductase
VRRLIEATLVTLDGVFEDPVSWGFADYRDDAYLQEGLGMLLACDAMVIGRSTYEANAQIWPARAGAHPWASRLNEMKKYVYSSTLDRPLWTNTTIIREDAPTHVGKLKQEDGPDLLLWGHGLFGEAMFRADLVDVLDLSIHPIVVGQGKQLFRPGQTKSLRLVATKSFSKGIVKLTYERA